MAAVFSDFGNVPDNSEPLTICCKSVVTQFSKFEFEFEFFGHLQIVNWSTLNCDIRIKIFLGGRRDRRVSMFACVL